MVKKTNKFNVKDLDENKIVIEEQRIARSPLSLFFVKNGKLVFAISCLFSITVFIIAFYLIMINMKESSIVMYESNGVKVTFDGTDNSILNGTPITDEYAGKVFDNALNGDISSGVVIEVDRIFIKNKKGNEQRTIMYYSDNTALIKHNDGSFTRVYSVDGEYGISKDKNGISKDKNGISKDKNGIIDSRAVTKKLTGRVEKNKELGISLLYLSDGSIEVTKDNVTFFVRNSDITNTNNEFYTNLSGVSLPIRKDNGNTYYSDGTIKENNGIVVDGIRYEFIEKKDVYSNIKVIYYENGYAEVVKDNFSIMVKNSNHIVYTKNKLEIIENVIQEIKIKDIMDIKEIELENMNNSNSHYIVVLEETNDYSKHNINKRLDNKFIHFNVYANGNKKYNNVLDKNLKDNNLLDGVSFKNNTYLLYEGVLEKSASTSIKLGLWVDYVGITNEYMNSALIGTIKVYVESLS